jgi:hypothetical protein
VKLVSNCTTGTTQLAAASNASGIINDGLSNHLCPMMVTRVAIETADSGVSASGAQA